MKIYSYGQTDVGNKRELNEDSFAVLSDEGLFIVADGMGGHNAGEIASTMSIETIIKFFRAGRKDEDMTWPYKLDSNYSLEANKLKVGIKFANRRIYRASVDNTSYNGMGTTIVALLVNRKDNRLYIAHVGDSRCYRFYKGKLEQITEDHSLVNEYLRAGQITKEQAEKFPHKNVIMRALGMKENVVVDLQEREILSNEIYLSCSDGLSDMIKDEEIEKILNENKTLKETTEELIKTANKNGGKDNITVTMLKTE